MDMAHAHAYYIYLYIAARVLCVKNIFRLYLHIFTISLRIVLSKVLSLIFIIDLPLNHIMEISLLKLTIVEKKKRLICNDNAFDVNI